jgi:hypothetical protein
VMLMMSWKWSKTLKTLLVGSSQCSKVPTEGGPYSSPLGVLLVLFLVLGTRHLIWMSITNFINYVSLISSIQWINMF